MAYNEKLANRVREIIALTHHQVEEKKMFGGLCFMVNDKMSVGVQKEQLMVRIDPDIYENSLEQEDCSPMNFTGKVMKGFVFVEDRLLTSKSKLDFWLKLALDYNRMAKVSKMRKQ